MPTPEVIGPYRILERLGAGGMGEVYLAEQTRPLRRRVAVKIIKRGMDTEQVIARFESERQALALMNHPHIAKVLDAGDADGRPYFVMEYVPGVPITEYCDRQRQTTRERLELFRLVCHALQHAHQKGIIHRDLKPSNVLVTVQDGQAIPKVIDFGVAKATEQRLTERTLFTQHGLLVGTPEYMSPEQADLTGLDVDTTTDIYSLGVLLYELLVGTLPFAGETLRKAGFDEMRRIIREDDPVKPSTKLSSLGDLAPEIAKRRRTDLRSLTRQLKGDLEWITLKALEKTRTRRYATASEFASDIDHYLAGDPVLAGPPGFSYRVRKLALKHRRAAAVAIVVIVVLAASAVVSTAMYVRSERFRQAEAAQRHSAERESYVANVRAAAAALEEGSTAEARRRLEATPEHLRKWEWFYLWKRLDSSIAVLQPNHGPVLGVAFAPDGSRIVAHTAEVVDEWDARTRQFLRSTRLVGAGAAGSKRASGILAVSPDGRRAVVGGPLRNLVPDEGTFFFGLFYSFQAGEAWVVDVRSGATIARLPPGRLLVSAKWMPDGERLLALVIPASVFDAIDFDDAVDSPRGEVLLWDVGRDEPVKSVPVVVGNGFIAGAGCTQFAPSRDGRYFAVLGGERVSVFTRDGAFVAAYRVADDACSVGFGYGREVLVESFSALTIWNNPVLELVGDRRVVPVRATTRKSPGRLGPFVLADGRLYSAWDSSLRTHVGLGGFLDLSFVPQTFVRRGHAARITNIAAFDPKVGRYGYPTGDPFNLNTPMLATSSLDGTVRLWTRTAGADYRGFAVENADAFRVVANSKRIAVSTGGGLKWSDLDGPNTNVGVNYFKDNGPGVALSQDDSYLAGSDKHGRILVASLDTTVVVAELTGHTDRVDGLAFTPTGGQLVSGSRDGTIRVWNLKTRSTERVMGGGSGPVNVVALSANGDRVVAGTHAGIATIWDIGSGSLLTTLKGHSAAITDVAFMPDGSRVATGSSDGTIRVWDVSTGRQRLMVNHTGPVGGIAVHPDGSRVASASFVPSASGVGYEGLARVWDLSSGALLLTIKIPDQLLTSIAFTPDGSRLAFAGSIVGVWETGAANGGSAARRQAAKP